MVINYLIVTASRCKPAKVSVTLTREKMMDAEQEYEHKEAAVQKASHIENVTLNKKIFVT